MTTHVRVFSGTIQHARVDDARAAFYDEILPQLQAIAGYQGSSLLLDGDLFSLYTVFGLCGILPTELSGFVESVSGKVQPMLTGALSHVRFEEAYHERLDEPVAPAD